MEDSIKIIPLGGFDKIGAGCGAFAVSGLSRE